MALLPRSQPHTSGVDPFRALAGPCTCECGKIVKPTAWLRMRVQLYRSVCQSAWSWKKTFQSPWTPCPICRWRRTSSLPFLERPNHGSALWQAGRNFWDGTFFLLIAAAEPLEANTESSEEVSYARFFDLDIFSQLKGVSDVFRTYVCGKTSTAIARLDVRIS